MEFCMKPHELRPGDIAYIERLYLPLSISLLFFYTIAIALFRSLGLMITSSGRIKSRYRLESPHGAPLEVEMEETEKPRTAVRTEKTPKTARAGINERQTKMLFLEFCSNQCTPKESHDRSGGPLVPQ